MHLKIAVALVLDRSGRALLVRKRGTRAFMQPGGKIEPGERAATALVRELEEELSIEVPLGELQPLGQFSAVAANEPGATLDAEAFQLQLKGEIQISAEIAEAVWIDPSDPGTLPLAPLTEHSMLPLAAEYKPA